MSEKFVPERKAFRHNDKTIYEWEQTLDGVDIYIKPPEGTKAKLIDCKITSNSLSLGLKGNPPYLKHNFSQPVKTESSLWLLEDGEIHISLQKMSKGVTWLSAFKGHESLDPIAEEKVKKQLMLERFQEENPGFDFSQAQFSGNPPDPKTFMGGIA